MSSVNDYSGSRFRGITVYGWSGTQPGTDLWTQAETVGALAAKNGFSVVTGGYCGSMEAVSKGAYEALPAEVRKEQGEQRQVTREELFSGTVTSADKPDVLGVTATKVFPHRKHGGNQYLTKFIDTDTIMYRIDDLTALTRYYIILPGTLGTLQEASCIWTMKLLNDASRPSPVIIAFRDPWEKCLGGIGEALKLPEKTMQLIQYVDTPEEAIEIIKRDDAALKQ